MSYVWVFVGMIWDGYSYQPLWQLREVEYVGETQASVWRLK